MLFYTIYGNYDHKLLAGIKKLAILWDKLKKLALRKGLKVSQKKRNRENELMVYIQFKTKELGLMLVMNSGICLRD